MLLIIIRHRIIPYFACLVDSHSGLGFLLFNLPLVSGPLAPALSPIQLLWDPPPP